MDEMAARLLLRLFGLCFPLGISLSAPALAAPSVVGEFPYATPTTGGLHGLARHELSLRAIFGPSIAAGESKPPSLREMYSDYEKKWADTGFSLAGATERLKGPIDAPKWPPRTMGPEGQGHRLPLEKEQLQA